MTKQRASFYVDGFNLYHALHNLNQPHLKWLSLWKLANRLIPSQTEQLESVLYFSALSTHLPEKLIRHRQYIEALKQSGVECVMGRFRPYNVVCYQCQPTWQDAEEKETDGNIAVRMLDDAYQDRFDVCYLISGDSDLAPAFRAIKRAFPSKELVTVSTPLRPHSSEILSIADRKLRLRTKTLQPCLLPETGINEEGQILFSMPKEYRIEREN